MGLLTETFAWLSPGRSQVLLNFGARLTGGVYYPGHAAVAIDEGGATPWRTLDLQPTGVNIKATAGTVYGGLITNCSAGIEYVKIYDKATAPTSGDTPVMTIAVNANQSVPIEAGGPGIAFASGIGIRGTTGVADADTGAPTTNDLVVVLLYA